VKEHQPQQEDFNVLVPEHRRRAIERQITRRQALSASVAGIAGLYLAGCGGKSGSGGGGGSGASSASTPEASKLAGKPIEKSLLLANWSDYSDPKDYKAFTKQLGPKITVEGYGSNDELIAKMSAGGSAYDVVVPSASYVPECIQKGLLMPLDHSLIPNLKNLEESFTKLKYDPGNKYSITKDYGITSFYYRTDVVKDPPTTIVDWFKVLPKYKGKKINFIEGGSETWGMFMLGAGKQEDSTDEADYKAALDVALSVKPAITTINSTYIERLGQGQIDIGLGWNGDILRAAIEAKKKGITIEMTVPDGPGEYWTDNWAIAAAAKNPVAAHKWINFVLQPDIAANEWNYVGYKVPVVGAEANVDPKISKSPMVDIPPDKIAGYSTTIVTPEIADLTAKYYSKFKA
jgi:spermidine/putrescine transport system substrate-binding protein